MATLLLVGFCSCSIGMFIGVVLWATIGYIVAKREQPTPIDSQKLAQDIAEMLIARKDPS